MTDTIGATADIQARLRSVVLDHLAARGLQTSQALSDALGIVPSAAEALLARSVWPIERSLWVADRLSLGITLEVTEVLKPDHD